MAKILVVDDMAMGRRLAGDLLTDAGYEVFFAVDGREALRQIENLAPDLVVTDLVMPQLNGLELVTALQSQTAPPPVIIMTSQGSEETAVAALQAGAASYVPKRQLAAELHSTVRRVINAARERQHHHELLRTIERQDLHLALPADTELISPLSSHLYHAVADVWGVPPSGLLQLCMALEEALTNALYHGNLELSSELRQCGREDYWQLASQRCRLPPYCHRRVYVAGTITKPEARFTIRDEGRGFDPAGLRDPTAAENLESVSGRGVMLMRAFMSEVSYNPSGNEVTMVKVRDAVRQSPGAS
ncbi:MAG: response regulator [Planctomycetales bacterium]